MHAYYFCRTYHHIIRIVDVINVTRFRGIYMCGRRIYQMILKQYTSLGDLTDNGDYFFKILG